MPDGTTAAERLRRLLHILPAASVEGGVPLEDLARDLEIDVQTLMGDITEVTARSYYHPAGSGDDIQITLEADRVAVWTTGAFRRPVKLSPLEAFCLALGLRGMRQGLRAGKGDEAAAPAAPDAADLLHRVESHLTAGESPAPAGAEIHATDAEPDPDGVRDLLAACARDRLRCRIRYLKPADEAPEDRVIHPCLVAHAEGSWYVIAWCERAQDGRAFRLDRILGADVVSGGSDRRDDLEPDRFIEGGRVYHPAGREIEVVVRYSPKVARWVEEWARDAEPEEDGSVLVRHRVADPDWVVRHVLRYGGEATVVEPAEVRQMLAGG